MVNGQHYHTILSDPTLVEGHRFPQKWYTQPHYIRARYCLFRLILVTLIGRPRCGIQAMRFAVATPVFAHDAGPCSGSGRDYAQHRVMPNATSGMLGACGHVPGEHQGFSLCNPSGQ